LQQRFDSLFAASKETAAVEQSPGTLQQCVDTLDKRLGTYRRGSAQGITDYLSANDSLTGRLKWPFIGICLIVPTQGYASFYYWMRS
jgi:hypothetical protein